jgi:hypothetical protein
MKPRIAFTVSALLLASAPLLAAGDGSVVTLETESAAVDSYAIGHSSTVENRISGSFAEFSGSPENASALVTGLRQGTSINLVSTAPDGSLVITGFTPATGPMGYGNVRTSLALAQQQLAGLGVINPTPEQLAAALNGGPITYVGPNGVITTTTLRGVLELRASGMGWGEIAQTYGTKLGPVINGLKATHGVAAQLPPAKGAGAAGVSTAGSAASVHGAPKKIGTSGAKSPSTAASQGSGHAYGQGIVSAHGVGANGVVSSNPGKGHAYGVSAKASAPISTATGAAAGAGAANTAGASNAHGDGNAYGHGKAHGKN